MVALIVPARWRQQPTTALEVDWNHPLARGLVYCVVGNHRNAPDLVGGARVAPLNTSGLSTGPRGVGLDSGGTSSFGWWSNYRSDPFRTISNQHTIAMEVVPRTFTANSTLLSAPYNVGSWTAPFASLILAREGSGTSTSANLQIATTTSGTLKAVFAAGSLTTGERQTLVATRSNTAVSLLRNDVAFSTTSNAMNTNPVIWGAATTVSLMNRSNSATGEGTNGAMYWVAVWNRALSAQEARELYYAPYQFLRPQASRLFHVGVLGIPQSTHNEFTSEFTSEFERTIGETTAASAATLPKTRTATAAVFTPSDAAGTSAATLPKARTATAAVRTIPNRTAASASVLPRLDTVGGFLRQFSSEFDSGFANDPTSVVSLSEPRLPALTGAGTGVRTIPARTAASAARLPGLSATAAAVRGIPAGTSESSAVLPKLVTATSGAIILPAATGTAALTLPVLHGTAVGLHGISDRTAVSASALPRMVADAVVVRTIPDRTAVSASTVPKFTMVALGFRTIDDSQPVPVAHALAPSWRTTPVGIGLGAPSDFLAAHDPREVKEYTLSWGDEMTGSVDRIATSDLTLSSAALSAGVRVHAVSHDTRTVTFWLKVLDDAQDSAAWNGQGTTLTIRTTVSTFLGRVFERTVPFTVRQL